MGGMAKEWVLLLLTFSAGVEGLRIRSNMTFNVLTRVNQVVPWFGMAGGGTVNINLELAKAGWPPSPPPDWINVYLAVFNYKQWVAYELQNFLVTDEFSYACKNDDIQCIQLCSLPSVWGSPHFPSSQSKMSFNVSETQEYTLVLLSCAPTIMVGESISVDIDLEMLNPGGGHVSLEKAPLGTIFAIFFALYLVMCGLCAHLVIASRTSSSVLQPLFGICLVMKTLEMITNLAYFQTYAVTGIDSKTLHQATHAAEMLSAGAFLNVLLLLSLGWGINRPELSRREKRLFWVMAAFYHVFGLLHSICETPSVCQGYLLSFWVVKFMITFAIIVAINANIERLRHGGLDLPRPTTPTELYLKLSLFQHIRMAFLACLVLPVALMMIDLTVLSWEQEWVSVFLQELMFIVVYALLGHSFMEYDTRINEILRPIDTAAEGGGGGDPEGEEMQEHVARAPTDIGGDGAGEAGAGDRRSPPPVASPGVERGAEGDAVYRRQPADASGVVEMAAVS